MDLFVQIWRKELDPFFKYDSKKWTFFKTWLTELNFFFFFEFDSQNWTLSCWIRLNKLNLFFTDSKTWHFFNVIQRVFFKTWLYALNPFLNFDSRIRLLKNYDSQNGTLLFNLTQRIEPFSKYCSKNWTLVNMWLEELNPFSKYCSKNWTLFNMWLEELNIFFKRTFSIWLKGWKFSICFEELNPFWYDLKNWLFWKNESNIWTLFENDSKNWFFSYYSNNWALFWKKTHRIEFFKVIIRIEFFFLRKIKELKELNPSCISLKWLNFFCWTYDSKNLNIFFFNLTQRIAPTFFFLWFKYLDLFHMTQRIEPSLLRVSNTWTFSKKWTLFFKAQSFFINKKTHRIEFFLNPTHRIEFFCDLNRLISWIWRKDLNHFFQNKKLKELVFFKRLKELNFFMNMTLRTKLFLKVWLKEFFGSMPQRISLFF